MPIELTPKQRRRGLDFAERVAELAALSPDAVTKKELYGVVKSMRRRYGYSEAEKASVIMATIRVGASSVADLIRETGIDRSDVWKVVQQLETDGSVRFQKISARDGRGRPSFLFFPVENG